jgi:hypothetical protein
MVLHLGSTAADYMFCGNPNRRRPDGEMVHRPRATKASYLENIHCQNLRVTEPDYDGIVPRQAQAAHAKDRGPSGRLAR